MFAMSNRAKTLLLLLIDYLLLGVSVSLSLYVRYQGKIDFAFLVSQYEIFSVIFLIWLTMYFVEGLYTLKTYNPGNLSLSLLRGTTLSVALSVLAFYLAPTVWKSLAPKTTLAITALFAFPLLLTWRRFFFNFFSHSSRQRSTFLVGSPETLLMVKEEMKKRPYLGYKIAATCTPDTGCADIPKDVELIAVERSMTKDHELYQAVFQRLGSGVEIMDLAKFAEQISGKIPLNSIDESWFIEYCAHQDSRSYDVIKSLGDKLVAVLLLIILAPFALIFLPLLMIFHGRPLFFSQTRTGLNNKTFTLYKLRTMVVDAEKNGAQWAKPKDARITRIGHFLRKTRLDELPQLINILKGEMSLVGPRPERPEIIENKLAPSISYYALRHLVKPGVTGWAQVTFRYGFSTEDSMEKLQYDLYYVKNKSLWLDLLVLIKTVKTVLTGAGQ